MLFYRIILRLNAQKFVALYQKACCVPQAELGLTEESQGLLALPEDAPMGKDLRAYLQLDDYIIDVSITPNRGDCLSISGIAREVSALTNTALNSACKSPKSILAFKMYYQLMWMQSWLSALYRYELFVNVKADAANAYLVERTFAP